MPSQRSVFASLAARLRPLAVRLRPLAAVMALAGAISSSGSGCGGTDDEAAPTGTGAPGSAGTAGAAGAAGSAGGLQPFTPPPNPGPGKFQVTASGEDLVVVGFPFVQGTSKSGDPSFVDGWEVTFEHVIVTFGAVTLNETPDLDPDDKSKLGKVVQTVSGPWAVDLTKGTISGKSGEQVTPLVNLDGPFVASQRYALSYDVVSATTQARNVNLDAEALTLYQKAIEGGWSVVFVGRASFKGPPPNPGTVFEKIPREVSFSIGMKNPTSAINCENPDLGKSALGEDFARGVQILGSGTSFIQLTVHLDHAFWDRLNEEGAPVHFDQIAAVSSTYGAPGAPAGVVTADDLEALDHTGFVTKAKEPLPTRSLVPDYTAPGGTLSFDANGSKFPKNSYGAYLRYSQAAGYHLGADGECLIKRNF